MRTNSSQTRLAGGTGVARRRTNRLILVAVVLVGVILWGLVLTLVFSFAISPGTQSFSFQESVPQTTGTSPPPQVSLLVSDVNGGINLVPGGQGSIVINGTITARGFGSSPGDIRLVRSSVDNNIVFQAKFPNSSFFFGGGLYSVAINVYVPASVNFSSLQLSTVNGRIKAFSLTATSLTMSTANGSLDFSCVFCGSVKVSTTNGGVAGSLSSMSSGGTYSLASVNGKVALTLPASASFTFDAKTVNGSVQTHGLNVTPIDTATHHLSGKVNGDGATVILSTVNGSITLTGT